jgi:GNAT superfamily N-acetyltransferase
MTPRVEIEPLGSTDIERCMDLAERVGWPREPSKWELILSLGPGFGVVASDGALSAMVAFPRHEGASFVAMMAVDPREQGRGLGRSLLEHAMRAVGEPLMLYATEQGRPLYERLGFREVDRATKHFGVPVGRPAPRVAGDVRSATPEDHAAIEDADARGYGVRRTSLVRALLARAERTVVDDRGGFAIRWSNGHVAVVGPVVAASEDRAIALIDSAVVGAAGGVRVDVAIRSPRVDAHVVARGLESHGESPLMTWDQGPLLGERATYHALALQAFG